MVRTGWTKGSAQVIRKQQDLKPIRWVSSCNEELRRLPQEVRYEVGFALYYAQIGEHHPDARRMKGSLRSVTEIRVNDAAGTYRAIYTVEMPGVVYVLDVFQKKSKSGIATPRADLGRILARLRRARSDYEDRGPPK